MSNITKLIVISLIALVVVVLAVFLLGNLYFTVNTAEQSSEQVATIRGETLEDGLIAKSYSYEDHLVFTYVPRDPEQQIDLYADYELKEDGTTIEAGNHRPYENISVDNPIVLEVQRNPSSVYELDISVEDEEENLVHKSSMTIRSQNSYN